MDYNFICACGRKLCEAFLDTLTAAVRNMRAVAVFFLLYRLGDQSSTPIITLLALMTA